MIPLVAFAAVVAVMYVELRISQRHEQALRASGAYEPPGDVYRWMRIVYPACFFAMTIEGLIAAASRPVVTRYAIVGLAILVSAKALKFWAIASLGPLWSFRVLVRPDVRLVTAGPYRYLNHPNYLAIVGELTGMALIVRAPVTGIVSLVVFTVLLVKRIRVEERALGLR